MAKGLTVTGEVVEIPGDMFRVVDEIQSRWPNLWVTYLNPDHCTSPGKVGPCLGDAPYQIWERTEQGPRHIMDVWKLDQSVIDRLHASDGSKYDILAEIDKHNAKVKKAEQDKKNEELAEGQDMSASALGHFAKGRIEFHYTNEHGEKRVIKDGYAGPDRSRKVM